jgi:acyl carrier protein
MNVETKIIEIICDTLGVEKSDFSINDDLFHTVKKANGYEPNEVVYGSPRDGFSSCDFEYLIIIMDVEAEFGIDISDDESEGLAVNGKTSDLISLVESKLGS